MALKPVVLKVILCTFWLAAVGAGFFLIGAYQNDAGAAGGTPERWPSQSQITPDPKRSTLLMFAHPACPCSRASVEELNRVLARCEGQVAAHVLFLQPDPAPAGWTQTDLRRSAARIPGIVVQDDLNGKQARHFGAETSGYVVLYDSSGQLIFSGGITGSRGHAGDNPGATALLTSITTPGHAHRHSPVFGCALRTPNTPEIASQ